MALDAGSTYVIIHWDVAEISGYDPASSPEHGNITDYCLLSCHKPAISSANYPPVFETSLKTDAWFSWRSNSRAQALQRDLRSCIRGFPNIHQAEQHDVLWHISDLMAERQENRIFGMRLLK